MSSTTTNDTVVVRPLDTDGVTACVVGTVLWTLATVVLYVRRDALIADGDQWWLWVSVTGIVLGLLGGLYCLRRRAKRLGT